KLGREQGGVPDRHDLIVVTVHNQRRHLGRFQVLGEVRLGESLDAVVVRLDAAHHALAPPVLYRSLGYFSTRPVEAVERAGWNIEEELGAIGGEGGAETVEYL